MEIWPMFYAAAIHLMWTAVCFSSLFLVVVDLIILNLLKLFC